MDIASRITLFRESSGLSKYALAKAINVTPSLITRLENGESKPSIDSLTAICQALGVSLSDFFAEETEPMDPKLSRLLQAADGLSDEDKELLTVIAGRFKASDVLKNS